MNVIQNPDFKSIEDMIFGILYFRRFNSVEHFEYIAKCNPFFKGAIPTYEWYTAGDNATTWKKWLLGKLVEMRSGGVKPFSTSFVALNLVSYLKKHIDKSYNQRDFCITEYWFDELAAHTQHIALQLRSGYKDVENLINDLEKIPTIGDFTSHECFVSLCYVQRYAPSHVFNTVWDYTENDYTRAGNGCLAGLKFIFGENYEKLCFQNKVDSTIGIYWLLVNAERSGINGMLNDGDMGYISIESLKPLIYSVSHDMANDFNLTLHNMEFWLCEFSKYVKMQTGKGKQRSKYIPNTLLLNIFLGIIYFYKNR
jgi:hypothetical protein